MTFSAFIPVALLDAANAALEAQGHGPANFSVPLRALGSGPATMGALHHGGVDPVFRAHVAAIPGVTVVDASRPGRKEFGLHCAAQGLRWTDTAQFPASVTSVPQ